MDQVTPETVRRSMRRWGVSGAIVGAVAFVAFIVVAALDAGEAGTPREGLALLLVCVLGGAMLGAGISLRTLSISELRDAQGRGTIVLYAAGLFAAMVSIALVAIAVGGWS